MVEDRGGLGLADLQTPDRRADGASSRSSPGLTGVSAQFRSNTPQLFMDIDRTKVESLGVPLHDVNQTLQMYLGSLYVNSFNEFGRYWQVNVQAEGQFRNRVEDINLLQVRNKWGGMVPLGTLVNVREIGGPVFVTRYNLSTAAPDHRQPAAGDQLGRRDRRHRRAGRGDPAAVDEDRVDRADVHADPGRATPRCTSSPSRSCASSWPWPRSTRAGRCRWR